MGGEDLRGRTYLERREHLDQLPLPSNGPILLSPFYQGIPVSRMLEVAAAHQVEGMIGKRVDSVYPGVTRGWPINAALSSGRQGVAFRR